MHLQKTGSRVIPRERRCCQIKADGHACGAYTVKGYDRCHMHGFYRDLDNGRSSIEVPLLEDKNSILLVVSQVARALGQGMMPASNANAIIRCCNVAQRLLEQEAGDRRQEAGDRSQESEDGSQETESTEECCGEDEPNPGDATVSRDCDVRFEEAGGNPAAELDDPRSPRPEATRYSAPADGLSDAGGAAREDGASMQAAPEPDADGTADGIADPQGDADEPQPWTVEPARTFVAPPQFADAPDKFQRALDRASGQHLEALIRRNKEIWRRGGSVLGG